MEKIKKKIQQFVKIEKTGDDVFIVPDMSKDYNIKVLLKNESHPFGLFEYHINELGGEIEEN